MLSSKFIKTWFVFLEKPNFIKADITNFKVDLTFTIIEASGHKVNKLVNTYDNYKLCLNKYVPKPKDDIETFYVKLNRSPINRGFRGSTRPFLKPNSMSTLHLQDGQENKIISIFL